MMRPITAVASAAQQVSPIFSVLRNKQRYQHPHRLYSSASTPADKCTTPSNKSTDEAGSTSSSQLLPPAPFIPRRSLLYVPGDDTRKLRKATQLQCDFIALDCEDGVAATRKRQARETIRAFYDTNLNETPSEFEQYRKSEWSVRLNGWQSGECEEDLRVVVGGRRVPETLLLPKCESAAELREFSDALTRHCTHAATDLPHRIALVMFAESCSAILNLPAICQAAADLSRTHRGCLFDPAAIVFGSDDFCASLGATRTASSAEISYARQHCVLVAKAFGLQAIDMVHIDFRDLEGLRSAAEEGARMGYTGKQCIHPDQLETVQAAFVPAPERVEWAEGLIRAFEEHQRAGKGAFVYRNQMIDMPTMRQAQNVLDTIKLMK